MPVLSGNYFICWLKNVKSLALLSARHVDTDSSGDSNNVVDLTHMTDDELETTMNRLDISDTPNVSIVTCEWVPTVRHTRGCVIMLV